MHKSAHKLINVTTVVTTVFCERKSVLDALHGKATTRQTQRNMQLGDNAHAAYAKNSFALMLAQKQQRQGSGSRLFIFMALKCFFRLKTLLTRMLNKLIDAIFKRNKHQS